MLTVGTVQYRNVQHGTEKQGGPEKEGGWALEIPDVLHHVDSQLGGGLRSPTTCFGSSGRDDQTLPGARVKKSAAAPQAHRLPHGERYPPPFARVSASRQVNNVLRAR